MKRTPITKVMSAHLTTIQRGQRISEAYEIFKNAPFHHLPVLDGDAPVGVLSQRRVPTKATIQNLPRCLMVSSPVYGT
jgi:predicted transcriptional regulator